MVTVVCWFEPDWYSMLVPDTELTVNVDESVVNPMLLLVSVQLPVLPVMQLLAPPGAKLPLTVALATGKVVFVS